MIDDLDEVHEIYRDWRRVADSYDPPRVFVAEAWVTTPERLARYLRPDELHTAFNFHYLQAPWTAEGMRESIDESFAALGSVGAPVTWVLSNHDVVRHVSRFGRPDHAQHKALSELRDEPFDLALGTRRARAAALLSMALPGSVYLYQGEELGLWEVEDLPPEVLRDPTWEHSGYTDPGRDGCRVPLPWSGQEPPFGFGEGAEPWLPQPAGWATLTAERSARDPRSMLTLYRHALRLRRAEPGLTGEAMVWVDMGEEVLAFDREGVRCVINFGAEPVDSPEGAEVLLASGEVVDGRLPRDTAVWLRLP